MFSASSHLSLDDFVEMTKKYAQGVAPSPVMAAAGGDDDDDEDDEIVVRNPDELPLQQKVAAAMAPMSDVQPIEDFFVLCLFVAPFAIFLLVNQLI